MKTLKILIYVSCLGWIAATDSPAAGLVLTAQDYPAVGTRNTTFVDTSGNAPVVISGPGEGQTWVYTDALRGDTLSYAFVLPSETPFYISGFSSANWAIRTKQWLTVPAISVLSIPQTSGFYDLCYYETMRNDSIQGIGMGTTTPFNSGGYLFSKPSTDFVFPMQVGSQWTKSYATQAPASLGSISGTLVAKDSSISAVDASGRLTIPRGTFDCLRVKSKRYLSLKAQIPIFTSVIEYQVTSDTFIVYDWYARSIGQVLEIISKGGEKNEQFTTAGQILRLQSTNVVVDYVCDPGCEAAPIPRACMLEQNHPNPFNPETQIRFNLPGAARVRLTVYDLLGQEIAVLMDGTLSAGDYTATWNARDALGRSVPSGIYIYRLETASGDGRNAVQTKKMILAR
jgi:hypothetical protein